MLVASPAGQLQLGALAGPAVTLCRLQ